MKLRQRYKDTKPNAVAVFNCKYLNHAHSHKMCMSQFMYPLLENFVLRFIKIHKSLFNLVVFQPVPRRRPPWHELKY